jgi:hypothetical protein
MTACAQDAKPEPSGSPTPGGIVRAHARSIPDRSGNAREDSVFSYFAGVGAVARAWPYRLLSELIH